MTYKLLPALAVLALIAGCDMLTPSRPTSQDILPLAVGNEWIFTTTTTFLNGLPGKVRTDTLRVVGTSVVDGVTWYQLFDTFSNEQYLAANRLDGLWTNHQAGRTPHTAFRLVYKYPAAEGERYDLSDIETARVVDLDAEVDVPAGTYRAIEYETLAEQIEMREREYYVNEYPCRFSLSPDLGFVRIELAAVTFGEDGHTKLVATTVRELTKVTLN